MVHSRKLQRGVMDRSFISKKCCFLKDMTHSDVLKKCIESTWGEKEGKFYLSDGSGSEIADEDLISGAAHTQPWSLGCYMKTCNIYASRTRLYCVRIGMSLCTVISETLSLCVWHVVQSGHACIVIDDDMEDTQTRTSGVDQDTQVSTDDQEGWTSEQETKLTDDNPGVCTILSTFIVNLYCCIGTDKEDSKVERGNVSYRVITTL